MIAPNPTQCPTSQRPARRRPRVHLRRRRSKKRGVALILVLGALTILTVMLAEFQDETSAELGSALSQRDALKAEYAAKSSINLSRLLIASEPTIRKALAPLFMLMGARGGAPQIPVWEFADQVLGAFNDEQGNEAFASLASVSVSDGENLGLEGAGFEVTIVDEDSKINVNGPARGDAFSQQRMAAQLIGLMQGARYDAMFEGRDSDGEFTDRQTVCSALVDWTDPDQNAYVCDPNSNTAQQSGAAEDSFYQQLDDPYQRKNAAFDSLEELHLVRGVDDDFWATFVEPEGDDPAKRILTVWGQDKVNINTANPQTLLAVTCAYAVPGTPLCIDVGQQATLIMLLGVLKNMTQGAPIFASPKVYVQAVQGKGMFGSMFAAMGLQPVKLLSESELLKAITIESKVFSIYATGYVKAGKRETRVRIHSVVDFRGAPPPGMARGGQAGLDALAEQLAGQGPQVGASGQQPQGQAGNLTPDAIAAVLRPDPAGNVIYYRIY